jgi:hypothetical protein
MTLRIKSGLADKQLGNGMVVTIRSVKLGDGSRGERGWCFFGRYPSGMCTGLWLASSWGRWQPGLTIRVVLPGESCPLA